MDELNRPPEAPPVNLTGLALSGGGIRSATFNMGLLQGFNEHGWLRMFDYLSTVSGGGFIGAWWSAWLSRSYADIPDEWLNHDALPGDKNKEQRDELEKELKVKLRFNPNQVRNARGFLRRLMLASKNSDDPRQKLSIELWNLLASAPADPPASSAQHLTLQKLLEEFFPSEIKESSLQVKLRAISHRASLQQLFKDRFNQEQLDEKINKKPGEIVDALIEAAFDWLNDRLFGNGKGIAATTIYSWELFQAEGIELPIQTYHLSQNCPEDYRKLQLNRLLLEEVYPYDLGRGVFPLQEQIDPQRIGLQEAEVARGQWVNQEAAVDVLSAGRDPLHHLRLFANYLTPQRGVLSHDTWRAVSTFSRNLLLTWVVLLPLLVVVVLLGQVYFVLTESSANNFLSFDSWMHSSSNHSLAELAKLAAYPLGLLLSCALALAIPWLMIPEGDPWEADEKRWWRVRNPKWWAGKLRNITALLLAIATTLPAFRKHGWHRADYAYWILIPLLFTLSLVIYGYLLNRSSSGQRQWELYVRHTHLTITHSAVLVLLVVLTLVLGVAGFGPALIDYLLNTRYPKRVSLAGLLVILSVAAMIFTAIKSSPSSVSDAKRRRRPGARNRVIFAITPPLVLIVMAILFSWLIHNLIGSLAHDNDHSIRKGLVLGTCLGIAFSFFLVVTEMRWEGRFPRLLLLILWVVFVLWGVGALAEIVACTKCCEPKAVSAGHMFGWACQQIDERTHWQQSFLADYVNAPILARFGYGAILLAWLAGLLIGLRFVFPDSLRWKDWLTRLIHLNKFDDQSPSPQPQPASRQQTTIRWAKPSLMVICWLAVGASVVVWFRYGRGELQPLAVFSERIFVAWGFFMCAMIAVFEIFFSRGNNVRARFLLTGIYLLLLMFLLLDLSHSSSNYEVRRVVFGLLGVLLSWVIVLGWTADPNQLSMHQFYRARLVRAYLGASNFRRSVDRRAITQSVAGDDVRIKDLENSYRGGPYHIINTTLNLVGGSDLATTQRSAAVFTLTKNYCGSSRTGYRDTREYMNGQLTLGTAVAISGAAASPSMGSITPSAAQAMLMTLLNVRLGFWAPTPNKDYWQESQARLWPFLMLREFLSQTNDLASHCYLTDGAHFENTGLYSLVERGCRFIIISDCGADPNLKFHDLGEAIRRCRIDFGAEIDLKIHPFLKKSTGESSSHFAFGKIKYSRRHFESLHYENLDDDAREGVLIVLKPVLTGDEDADLSQYGREDAHGFPHQTTADQWYDEAQFESYRRLGQITAHALIERLEKEDKKLKDIGHQLKTGSSVSSEDVRRPFDLAKKILEKEAQYKKAEVISVKDEDEETTSNS
ncbi:MAG: patatin-like phospholipase family protein [Blastocatellia bacterium]